MKYFNLPFILLLFFCIKISAQQNPKTTEKYTVSGYVKEESTGEYSIGANVYIKELLKGTNTNQYGFYSITVEKGTYHLVISYLGFDDIIQEIKLDKDLRINVSIKPSAITADEVEISAEKNKNINSTQMGVNKLDIEEIKKLPAFLGEVDILKTIQLLPGVKSAGEGNSGFYVRGGGPDQNLILLDEAVVYNASHLFGFFSVFNGDAVKNINLIKGGMPAQYGGRLASVLDISMKEGNSKSYHAEGGIGVISSRLTIQGPFIKKDTGSFVISGRRTYIDILTRPLIKPSSPFKGSGYYFYDLNTKFNYRLSDKDRLFLSGYFGRDVFTYNNAENGFKVEIPWGNATTSLRWNHLFNDKLFMNTSAIFSDYNFSFGATQSGFEFKLFSGIRDWNFKSDFGYFPSVRHEIKFGANYTYHTFIPSNASAKSGDVEFDLGKIIKQYAHEAAVYISDDFDLTEKIRLNGGLRFSYFAQVGPFDRYVKDIYGNTIDTITYGKGKKVKDYAGVEPRLSARYEINKRSSVKASFTQNYQYVHLASLSAVSLPTDIWVPCSELVKPQFGTQYAIGYFRNFKDDLYESSVEVYYKQMKNQVEYKEGALPEDNVNDNADNQFTFGNGESYGAEFFLKKRTGKFNGWIGYTLSWTSRVFPEINQGREFYAKYDRRHDASVVLAYDVSKKLTLSTIFVYGTGNAITLPVARYLYEGSIVNQYGDRNSYRMAPYHRMDIAATLQGKKHKKYESSWSFAIFNVYNRRNPYFIYFQNEGDIKKGNLIIKAKQVSLFPILPSVTWNFKF